jgi:hypothetical protein
MSELSRMIVETNQSWIGLVLKVPRPYETTLQRIERYIRTEAVEKMQRHGPSHPPACPIVER